MTREIEAWEDEGGAATASLDDAAGRLNGTRSQIEWAERIKRRVAAEFDRVAASFRFAAGRQSGDKRADMEVVLEILDAKRLEVMGSDQAEYFIHDWHEIGGQVLQMIMADPRYQAVGRSRTARQTSAEPDRSSQP